MIRQPMLRIGVVGRATIGLLGVAAALLLAPVATAQPEVEANDAITAAWQANGGDTGPLGPKSGDVYPAGDGFAQNFASGKMFFTPDTGAHLMQGAILEKYEALGGPADSDLGFPTIDEGPGRAPDSRNSTLSAPDNPVIFWTPATGARVVRGAINAAWDKLGGSSGVLGVPAEDETYDGAVVRQKFTAGELSYDRRARTFTTVPPELATQLTDLEIPDDPVSAINAARRAAGGPLGPLGAAEGEPYPIGSDGMGQDFVNGKIFYSPETGANVVTGQVLAKYESVGGPEGDLGFPVTSEVDGGVAPASRMSTFAAEDKPVIFWTPDHGAVIVRGPMNAAWEKLGGATGELGPPVADQTENGQETTQRFSGGAISWNSATKRFSTEPANLASQLAGLEVPEQDAPPAPAQTTNDDGKGLRWTWWWLLAVVPLLLLGGLIAFAVVRNRRRGDDDDLFGPNAGAPVDDGRGYEPALAGGDGRAEDGREDTLFADRYAREGLGSLSSAAPAQQPASDEFPSGPLSFWGVPVQSEAPVESGIGPSAVEQEDQDAIDTAPTRVPTASEVSAVAADREPIVAPEDEPAAAPEPEPVVALGRDPLTDTGRHARIDIDEPLPSAPALRLPLDDPNEIPEGYPVKADTGSGLYWVPGDADYDEASAHIWFASEEMARTNGFVRGE
ncbi:LGFP repeat-containing protein [Mycolicibacterium pyrenivorans]|uniref:LGFP repeat-containing protein n=1 Tax=Mycolicibacterium pyrenivorans TaxID=187102 RepID=UPI0021F2AC9C|nr:hypothetical protein [Mycolicibacterium pyrenivorans]MCV7152228.1 LGFP repeat-containing protein [Mycolicibacterium pyrenivorans]